MLAIEFRRVVSVVGGGYHLDGVPACQLNLQVEHGGRALFLEATVAAGGATTLDLDFPDDKPVLVRGVVRDADRRPVAVMNYPKDIKAFYMRQNDDGKTVAAMDVLAPGIGEIIGGSQREERLDRFDARVAAMGLDVSGYGWSRDLRRYGSVPHAGFGLGFERTVAYVTGLANVRDVIPFPRTPGHARY